MPFHNSNQFSKAWVYALEKDFHSADGTPAQYAPGQPQFWGEEQASIALPSTPGPACLNADQSLLAVAIGHDIHIYELSNLSLSQVLKGHVSRVDAIAFHPMEAKMLVSCAMNRMGGSVKAEPTIIFWDLEEQRRKALLSEKMLQDLGNRATAGVVSGLQDSTSESSWAMNEEEKGELSREVGKAIAVLNIKSRVRDNTQIHGRLRASFGSQIFNSTGTSLAFLPGDRLRSNGDGKHDICIWDTVKKEVRLTLVAHSGAVMWVGFSPDDKLIGSVSYDKSFRIWSHETGELVHTFYSENSNWTGGFSKDSRFFAGIAGKGRFYVWDVVHGLEVATHEFDSQGRCRSLDWSPDGKQLAVGGWGGRLIVFDLKRQVVVQESVMSGEMLPEGDRRRMAIYLEVISVRYLPGGGRRIAYMTSGDNGLEVYDFVGNRKWRFAPRQGENDGGWGTFLVLEKRGLIACIDEKTIRFVEVPMGE